MLTIHQPSLEVYKEMDNVLYLARGKLMYYGPAHPDSITYFNPALDTESEEGKLALSNPDNAMEPLARDNGASNCMHLLGKRQDEYTKSKYHKDYVADRRDDKGQVQIVGGSKEKTQRRFGWRQRVTLTRRNLNIKRKDVANLAILLLQAPIIALLVAAVFSMGDSGPPDETGGVMDPIGLFLSNQNALGINAAGMFMLVASAVWFGTSNSAREIVGELAIYRRERMVNLKIPSYVLSKFAVLALLSLIQCAMLLGIAYPLLHFHGSFPKMLLLLWLCATGGLGFGLILSSSVRSTEAAVALVPLMLIPQLVLGGLIVPLKNFDEGPLKTGIRYVSSLMVARWTFEGLLHTEGIHRPPPTKITVTEDELNDAKRFSCEYRSRKIGRINGWCPTKEPEHKVLLGTFMKYKLAQGLDEEQDKSNSLDRYFGQFQTSYWTDVTWLLGFNIVFLICVCFILRSKDLKST